jgi:hypothetical protein
VLVLYLTIAVFHDPLPYPARQIAGVVVSWSALSVMTWLWVLWSRQECARPSMALRLVVTFGVVLFAFTMFKISNFDPLPRPWGKLLVTPLFPMMLGAIMWWTARNKDEVQRAAAFEGSTWGALVGVGMIFTSIFVVRYTPGVSEGLQTIALRSRNDVSPAAVGFALGAASSLLLVWISMFVSRGLWWRSRR